MTSNDDSGEDVRSIRCPKCKGSGRYGDDTAACFMCGGSGKVRSKRTPWRCRHGWHDLRFVSMSDVRTVDVPGHQLHHICRLVERCERCGLKRTRHHADLPKRPKMPDVFGSDADIETS